MAVVATALVIAAPVVLGAAATATTFIGSGFAAGGAAAGAAATVAGGLATAAVATAPVAAAAASIPVLGAAGTFVAGVGLASVGIGSVRPPSTLPNTLNHYTSAEPAIIMKQGLTPESNITYATNLNRLTPPAATNLLQLAANRPPPIYNYQIDVYKALQSGATLSGPSWVSGPIKGPFGLLSTGAWEWAFTGHIPPGALIPGK